MTYEEIVATLGFAGNNERLVRITTEGAQEVIGIPTSVDTHITAHEVYLHLIEDDSTEIALSLAAIVEVELL